MEPVMAGTVQQAFERLEWLAERQGREVWAAPAAYRLCRRVLECWPPGRLVPFICPSSGGGITIDDDEHAISIRVAPATVALVTLDWTTDGDGCAEQYVSLNRAALRRVLPGWLDAIDRSETFTAWYAANPVV